MKPYISVVITCFNYGQYIDECVNSVLIQSLQNFEVIIVEDCSTDDITYKKCDEQLLKDKRISVIHNKVNKGTAEARNIGIDNTKSNLILILDADDFLHMLCLEKTSECFRNGLGDIIGIDSQCFGSRLDIIHMPEVAIEDIFNSNPLTCTALFRKSDWKLIGGYKTEAGYYEDWEFWINMIDHDKTIYHFHDFPLLFDRRYEEGSRQHFGDAERENHIQIIKDLHPDLIEKYRNKQKTTIITNNNPQVIKQTPKKIIQRIR